MPIICFYFLKCLDADFISENCFKKYYLCKVYVMIYLELLLLRLSLNTSISMEAKFMINVVIESNWSFEGFEISACWVSNQIQIVMNDSTLSWVMISLWWQNQVPVSVSFPCLISSEKENSEIQEYKFIYPKNQVILAVLI